MARVFICYSHDDSGHEAWVLGLSEHLEQDGVEVQFDQRVGPAPADGWWSWAQRQIEVSDRVLCICTDGFKRRFDQSEEVVGQGVRFELKLISDLLAQGKSDRIFVLQVESASFEAVPLGLGGCARYVLPRALPVRRGATMVRPGGDYASLVTHLTGAVENTSPPDLYDALRSPEGAARPFSEVRLAFHNRGGDYHQVSLQVRESTSNLFVNERAWLAIGAALTTVLAEIDGQTGMLISRTVSAARKLGHPTRVQLHFHQTAHALDRLEWESAPFLDRPLHQHGDIALSRSFAVSDEEAPEIRVSPERELSFVVATSGRRPAITRQNASSLIWSEPYTGCLPDGLFKEFHWGTQENLTFDDAVRGADVLYLPLTIAVDPATPGDPVLAVPDSTTGSLKDASTGDLVKALLSLTERPIVLFLTPSSPSSEQSPVLYEALRAVAVEIATRGLASVILPTRPIESSAWGQFLQPCIASLKKVGVIDAAAAIGKNQLSPDCSSAIRVYLRNKSGRLWYAQGFTTVSGRPERPWDELRRIFGSRSDLEAPEARCVVLLGPGVDRDLKLYRRKIAREMARRHGFALSHRDEESLARVAEFIRVHHTSASSPGSAAAAEQSEAVRPHVAAFLDRAKAHFRENLPREVRSQHFDDSTVQLIEILERERAAQNDTPYAKLGKLRVNTFVTTNFHAVLQQALRNEGRAPVTAYNLLPAIGSTGGRRQGRNFKCDPAEPTISVAKPLVYHAYGAYDNLASLVLAESDHLHFFADFITPHDRGVAWDHVRGQLLDGTLLFLGFQPDSWDFRVLFSAITQLGGADAMALGHKVHVAVQLDPEDDLIIDPAGARAYFEGLLAPLGHRVFVYWGAPEKFLEDMESEVPSAFDSAASRVPFGSAQ